MCLVLSYIYLAVNISRHFAEELKDEGRKIKAIFVLFSLSYISRGIVYILQVETVIHYALPVYYFMYFFWDVLPTCCIMWYHLQAFKAEKKEQEEPEIDWSRQTMASHSYKAQSSAHISTESLQEDNLEGDPLNRRGGSLAENLMPEIMEANDHVLLNSEDFHQSWFRKALKNNKLVKTEKQYYLEVSKRSFSASQE